MSEKKIRVYDQFRTYVTKEMRKGNNQHLSVQSFDQPAMRRRDGPTHMPLVLEHVNEENEELYQKIREFKPGASLKTEKSKNGPPIHIAWIPWNDEPHQMAPPPSSPQMNYDYPNYGMHPPPPIRSHDGEKPKSYMLFLYVTLFLVNIMVGVAKTSAVDWKFLTG